MTSCFLVALLAHALVLTVVLLPHQGHGLSSQIGMRSDTCLDECRTDSKGPVCDEAGYEYISECVARQCAKIHNIECYHSCPCQANCNCSNDDKEKVCGANHVTYKNKCMAHCHEVEVECKCSKETAVCNETCDCWSG